MPVPCSSSSGSMARTPVDKKNTIDHEGRDSGRRHPDRKRYRFEGLVRSAEERHRRATSARVPPASKGARRRQLETASIPGKARTTRAAIPSTPAQTSTSTAAQQRTWTCAQHPPDQEQAGADRNERGQGTPRKNDADRHQNGEQRQAHPDQKVTGVRGGIVIDFAGWCRHSSRGAKLTQCPSHEGSPTVIGPDPEHCRTRGNRRRTIYTASCSGRGIARHRSAANES